MRLDPLEEEMLVLRYKMSRFIATWWWPPLLLWVLIRMILQPFTYEDYQWWWTPLDGALLYVGWRLWMREIREMAAAREKLREAHS